MITLQQIFVIGLAPLFVIAGCLAASLLLPETRPAALRARAFLVVCTVALAGAVMGAHIGLFGAPTLPPVPVSHVYFWAVAFALPPALVPAARANLLAPALRLLLSGVIAWMIVRRKADNADWPLLTTALWIAGLAVAMTAVGELWRRLAIAWNRAAPESSRIPAAGFVLAVALAGMCAAPVVLMDGSLDVASKLIGALVTACAALALAAVLARDASPGQAAAAVGGMLLPAIFLHAALYSTLHWGYIIPLCLAPLATLITQAPIVRNAPSLVRTAIALAATGLIAAIPAGIAVATHVEEYIPS